MKKFITTILIIVMIFTLFVSVPTLTYAASNDYTTWKQYDSAWGYETLWLNAQYKNMAGGGCWITSVAMLLRHYNVVNDSNVNTFNPLICCKRLMDYGIINSNGDFTNLGSLSKAYPGFTYAGSKAYSIDNVKNLYSQGYACIVHETKGHYVAVRSVSGNNVVVMDPGSNSLTTLTNSDQIQYFKVSGVINNAKVSTEKNCYNVGEKVTITPSASGAVKYTISIYKGDVSGDKVYSNYEGFTGSAYFTPTEDGTYKVLISCIENNGKYRGITTSFIVNSAQTINYEKEIHLPKPNTYTQGQFTDVPESQWYTDNIANAVRFGLMKGNSATTFNPYGDVTIAEAVTMAARIHSIYNTDSENFAASSGKWYQVYLDYAYNNGIITSSIYNTDVTKKATRSQFAEIFANSLPDNALSAKNSVSDNAIPDVKVTDGCAAYVYKLYRAGILAGGDIKGTFSPLTYITRAECATIVARMADSDNRVSFSLL